MPYINMIQVGREEEASVIIASAAQFFLEEEDSPVTFLGPVGVGLCYGKPLF